MSLTKNEKIGIGCAFMASLALTFHIAKTPHQLLTFLALLVGVLFTITAVVFVERGIAAKELEAARKEWRSLDLTALKDLQDTKAELFKLKDKWEATVDAEVKKVVGELKKI